MKKLLTRLPLLGPLALRWYRARLVRKAYFAPRARQLRAWLAHSRETSNFTYDLTPASKDYLAHFLAAATGTDAATVRHYVQELEADEALRTHIRSTLASSHVAHKADADMPYGRRLGWYALVRIRKPQLVVETGVDKGLGAVVLAAALLRNAAEGHPGRYVGTDINPAAGELLTGPYAAAGDIRYGDSLASLKTLRGPVDLFINDSDHSATYEAAEYLTIAPELAPDAYLLGDNAHATDALLRYAEATGRRFLYWQEAPLDHWYPGGGIGLAWNPRQ